MSELFAAGESDIPAIMEIERGENFVRLVGNSTESEHLAFMRDVQTHYFVIHDDAGEIDGFALLSGVGSGDGIVSLKRIALRQPGKGIGRQLLVMLIDRVFADPAHFRFWLEIPEENERARRACCAAGFVEEGILRESYVQKNGQRSNLVVMSILRGDWLTAFI